MTGRWLMALALGWVAAARAADPDGVPLADVKGEAKTHLQKLERLLGEWDVEAAQAELSELAKLAPADAPPVAYFQGRLAFEGGQYDDAVERFTVAG